MLSTERIKAVFTLSGRGAGYIFPTPPDFSVPLITIPTNHVYPDRDNQEKVERYILKNHSRRLICLTFQGWWCMGDTEHEKLMVILPS